MKNGKRTVLFAASVAPLREEACLKEAYNAISEERRRKVERLRMAEDKLRSIGAELLLRYALAEAGYGDVTLEYAYGENGKPSIRGREEIRFNLSHAGEYVLCAVSESEVGCDVEKIGKADLAVAKRFFLPEESDWIAGRESEEERSEAFFRVWTLKESVMKATGLGMKLPPNGFGIRIWDGGAEITGTVMGKTYGVKEFDGIPGYRCAVCGDDVKDAELHLIDMRTILS